MTAASAIGDRVVDLEILHVGQASVSPPWVVSAARNNASGVDWECKW